MPSEWTYKIQWDVSRRDADVKLSLKAGIENLRGLQVYQAVAEVAVAAFGDGKSKSRPPSEADIPKTVEDARARFKAIMG